MTAPNPQTDPYGWWDNLIDLHPPQTDLVRGCMDEVRYEFKKLGVRLIETTPPGPDLTVALRALKDACQHAIANMACHQDYYEPRPTRPVRDNPQA